MAKKVSFVASIATIVGLGLAIYSSVVSSDQTKFNQTINGGKNTIINGSSAPITINNNNQTVASTNTLVLRNNSAGISRVIAEPTLEAMTDESKFVCDAISGTPVSPTGRTAKTGVLTWKEVKIMKGECAGRLGWASTAVLRYE